MTESADFGFWFTDFTAYWPITRWISRPMERRVLTGAVGAARRYTWIDRNGTMVHEAWVAAGKSVAAWVPARLPDIVVEESINA